MLLLIFYVRDNKYALNTRDIIEIIPKIKLREIPHTPEFVSGVFNYHNIIIPVIDLCTLFHGEPCPLCLGTRIIIVKYSGEGNNTYTLGLIAERVLETRTAEETDLVSQGIKVNHAPYLGEILADKQEAIQIIHLDNIITNSVQKSLFADKIPQK